MLLCVLRSNLVLITILILLVIINTILTIATFTGSKSLEVAGGAFGGKYTFYQFKIIEIFLNFFLFFKKLVIAAFCAWYLALALILQNVPSYFHLKIWPVDREHTLSTEKV
jgi:succinate-acetate transporter protein